MLKNIITFCVGLGAVVGVLTVLITGYVLVILGFQWVGDHWVSDNAGDYIAWVLLSAMGLMLLFGLGMWAWEVGKHIMEKRNWVG